MRKMLFALALTAICLSASAAQDRRPLSDADIDDIAKLLELEDTRQYDAASLERMLASTHPEVRRRAAISIGRINDARGVALLEKARDEKDPEVAASVVFAVGQLRQPASVSWLTERLASDMFPTTFEAARALGKIRTPESRAALAGYLAKAPTTASSAVTVGEALLSIGRFTEEADVAPIVRWTTSPNSEIRWRATWALFRPRQAAAVPHLFKLTEDPLGDVRHWAVRGLTPAAVDAAALKRPDVIDRLARLFQSDPDRRVRTEALRVLLQYDDERAFGTLVNALYSPDAWIAVSAAEGAGRFGARATPLVPLLIDVAEPQDPLSVRVAVVPVLVTLAPDATATLRLAGQLAQSDATSARNAGLQALGRLGERGRAAFEQIAADPAMKGVLPTPEEFGRRYGAPPAGGRAGGGAGGGRAAGAGGGSGAPAPGPARAAAEYRQIVERWIVPDYTGAPPPRVIWETPRGSVELELYPGDAPFGVEHLMRVIESGDIVGTEFTRLVPNFVAQQQAIRNASTLRDEVNRRGLTRGNLSWASAGLDTGRPGYTLGHTPQPHNEGDFTALGRVVNGMDAVDKLELGDKVTGARIVRR